MSLKVRELVTKLGYDVDMKPLMQAEKSIDNLKRTSKQIVIGFTIAAAKVGFFVNEAAKMEQTEIAFETLLGSADLAQKKLDELFNFAKTTPFTLPGILRESKRLLAFGFEAEELIQTMELLGNISASVGNDKLPFLTKALADVRSAGRLMGREVLQFVNAGVAILPKLAEQLGVTTMEVKSLVEQGQISFEQVLQVLTDLPANQNRLMDRQSKTFLGIVSNIKDALILLSIDIGNELLPNVKELAAQFQNFLEQNKDLIKSRLVPFLRTAMSFMSDVVSIVKSAVRTFMVFIDAIGGAENAVKLLTKAFVALFALRILKTIGAITIAVFSLTKGIIAAKASLTFMRIAFATMATQAGFASLGVKALGNSILFAQAKALLFPILIGAAIAGLILIIDDFVNFIAGNDSILGKFIEKMDQILDKGKKLQGFLGIGKQEEELSKFNKAILKLGDLLGIERPGISNRNDSQKTNKSNSFLTDANNFFNRSDPLSNMFKSDFLPSPSKNQTNNFNVTVEAPIAIDGAQNPEEVSNQVQKGIENTLNSVLRQTLISVSSPVVN